MNFYTSVYKILSGKAFNAKYKDTKFIKFTNKECIHHDLPYNEGLVEDFQEFNPYQLCVGGGLHFCKRKDVEFWIENYCY